MARETDPTHLTPLIELLVEESDPGVRDRILVEAVDGLGVAGAVALWRETARGGWNPVLSRGALELLPSRGTVEAALDGLLPLPLAGGGTVLVAGESPSQCALALGSLQVDEGELDGVEALLVTFDALDPTSVENLEDLLLPPVPRTNPPKTQASTNGELVHDLRNLLTNIRTTKELLDHHGEGLDPEERDAFGDVFERECQRAGDLLIAALDRDDQEAPICVASTVVREVFAAEQAAARLFGLELELEIGSVVEYARCALAPGDFARVVQNLLVNAREACTLAGRREPPRRIRVQLRATAHEGRTGIELTVEDDGSGIPAALLPHVFEDGVTALKPGGSGIGLTVVRRAIEAVQGRVCADHRPTGGSVFTVWTPAHTRAE